MAIGSSSSSSSRIKVGNLRGVGFSVGEGCSMGNLGRGVSLGEGDGVKNCRGIECGGYEGTSV